MVSDNVIISLISTVGALAIAYVVNILAKKRKTAPPRDRMDTIFDGYEALIKRQQEDIDYKQGQLDQTQAIIIRLQKDLDETRKIVFRQQEELESSKQANEDLRTQLSELKVQYSTIRKD